MCGSIGFQKMSELIALPDNRANLHSEMVMPKGSISFILLMSNNTKKKPKWVVNIHKS